MNLNDIAKKACEWLRQSGPMNDIVISSRIRLARNLAGYPFLSKANESQREEIATTLRNKLEVASSSRWYYLDVEATDELDRQLLVERHLISRQHAGAEGRRGVAVSPDETVSVMVNEEDHLRIQVMRSGLQLDVIWEEIDKIDDSIEAEVPYAFHARYGYLTACPTNVGTGIRVSVMLHLPALKVTGEIERVFRASRELKLAIRGLFGEGTEYLGDFFQVSNQTTLGKTEQELIHEFKHLVIPQIVDYENEARRALVRERLLPLDDKVFRSVGVLRNARTISSEETLLHLSHVRMGINLGRIKDIDLNTVNELFLVTQPAHLQKIHGERLSGEQRSIVRAEYIRRRMNGN
ncbi:MAG: protein arginine kinase [Phycisphaerae bacterium]